MINPITFFLLARKRHNGYNNGDYEHYFRFQEYQVQHVLKEIITRGKIKLTGMKMLELAVGIGGYSPTLKKEFKNIVINDIRVPYVTTIDNTIEFKQFNVIEDYPFPDNSFDFVFCSSVIEHIDQPEKMYAQIKRILRPGGYAFISFPPFYSPVGGHGFKPFHYLGERAAIKITNKIYHKNIKSYATMYSRDYGTYGLYQRKISTTKKDLLKYFTIIDYWTRFSPLNTAKIPILNEVLTWHVSFLVQKK